jgi:hypothetical protein
MVGSVNTAFLKLLGIKMGELKQKLLNYFENYCGHFYGLILD